MENIDLEEYVLTINDIITVLETGKMNSVEKASSCNKLSFEFTDFQYRLYISLEKHDFWGGIDIEVYYNGETIFKYDFMKNGKLEEIFKIYKNRKTNEAVKSLKQKIKELDNEKIHLEKNSEEGEDLI